MGVWHCEVVVQAGPLKTLWGRSLIAPDKKRRHGMTCVASHSDPLARPPVRLPGAWWPSPYW